MLTAVFMGTGSIERYYKIFNKKVRADISKKVKLFDKLITMDNLNEYKDMLSEVEYVFSSWGMPTLSEQQIKDYLPKLKAVFYGAGSVQYFATPFLNCDIKVFSAWAANAVPVAEYTVAQIILANKGFYQSTNIMKKQGREKASKYCMCFGGNYLAKIGLLGAGMIGKNVIQLLKPYKFDVLVFDSFLSQQKAKELGVKLTSLEDVFESCDVISNHLANNQETKGILHGGLFSKMKENATFINTGRGAQVVESDLVKALKEKTNRTAILDVTDPEPPIEDHDFYKLDNVFLTPHIAGSVNLETQRMGEYMCQEFMAVINQKETKYEVTLEMLKTMA